MKTTWLELVGLGVLIGAIGFVMAQSESSATTGAVAMWIGFGVLLLGLGKWWVGAVRRQRGEQDAP